MAAVMPEYLWLVVVGSFAAFAFGWGTGSNDVANAFGTSVGAKTLTLRQAVIIAAIFEFVGAMVLGRVVTSVIAGGIAKIEVFYDAPEIYAYGMIVALTVGFVWQALASYWEYNVSATHSIIGAIIGFSLTYGGANAVNWAVPDTTGSSFPPYKGVLPIVLSWFFSPILTGIASALIFGLTRVLVLRRKNSYILSFWVLPFAVMLTSWINIYFVFTKGAKKSFQKDGDDWDDDKAAWVAAICMAVAGALTVVVVLPLLFWKARRALAQREEDATAKAIADAEAAANPDVAKAAAAVEPETLKSQLSRANTLAEKSKIVALKSWSLINRGLDVDIHANIEDDPIVAAMHENAEVFDPKAEYAFSYLQVFSAICVIFAHGAGEVGYMAGPLSTVWDMYLTGNLNKNTAPPIWIIIIGALGLVTGLATYGYNVTRSMGVRMAKLSPTRGFAAELATSMVIMIAAQYGLPTSSSQCITGGIIGVGMLEGARTGVNWKFFSQMFAMWVGTIVVVGVSTSALFAQGVYAPSVSCNKVTNVYETNVVGLANQIFKSINSSYAEYAAVYNTNSSNAVNNTVWLANVNAMTAASKAAATFTTYSKQGTVAPKDAVQYLFSAVSLLQQNTISTVGQVQFLNRAVSMCNNASLSSGVPYAATCRGPAFPRIWGTGPTGIPPEFLNTSTSPATLLQPYKPKYPSSPAPAAGGR